MMVDTHKLAMEAAQKAHAPYSKFPVGAVIKTSDGLYYSGCNIENASYPEGWCAETTAIAHMVMGGGGTIEEITVVALKLDGASPCGGCRQRISEFGTPETIVHLCDANGIRESVRLDHLLPNAFAKADNG